MKNIITRQRVIGLGFIILFSVSVSCDENSFLKEKPLSLYTIENSLITENDYQSAINYLYDGVRYFTNRMDAATRYMFYYGTDLAFGAADYYSLARLNDYKGVMVPTWKSVHLIWQNIYKVVNQANFILDRIKQADLNQLSIDEFRGQALFFRAYTYRILANLWGGVPLILEEITTPRQDFERASREDVYTQVKNDLIEAASLLKNIDEVIDGKISKQAALHLLSEIYICLGDYDNAIATASEVIDYPGTELMYERFGSFLEKPGDVYSDLFKYKNQNRSSGNTETLWALQYEYLNPGGGGGDDRPRMVLPYYTSISITENDENGNPITATAFKLTQEKGGRGIGWAQPTYHVINTIWEEGDIRNSEYNIVRDLKIDNPQSPAFGKWFVADGYVSQVDTIRQWYPFFMKLFGGVVPSELYEKDKSGNLLKTEFGEQIVLNGTCNSYTDCYVFRLAETYLLRAEAYLGNNQKDLAAADINAIRTRAHALPITADDVTIDYILDERLRELAYEEFRMCTLCRMGKLVERVKKYNPVSGKNICDYHNLWPIPYSEINKNIFAKIEQNPGY